MYILQDSYTLAYWSVERGWTEYRDDASLFTDHEAQRFQIDPEDNWVKV